MSSTRLSLPELSRLSEEQQKVYDEVTGGPRGQVRGPVHLWLHSPELAARAQRVGEFLRWGTVLDRRLSELAILLTARHYTCHYIWFNHTSVAERAGLAADLIDAIKHRKRPRFRRDDEALAHAFVTELLERHTVSDATLEKASALWGERGVVELGAIVGYYHMGTIVLATAQLDLPDGSKTCLPA